MVEKDGPPLGGADVVPMPERPLRPLSYRLYWLLVNAGRTQADIARAAGIRRSSVSAYLNGDIFPGPRDADKLARAFGVDVKDLRPSATDKLLPVMKDNNDG